MQRNMLHSDALSHTQRQDNMLASMTCLTIMTGLSLVKIRSHLNIYISNLLSPLSHDDFSDGLHWRPGDYTCIPETAVQGSEGACCCRALLHSPPHISSHVHQEFDTCRSVALPLNW